MCPRNIHPALWYWKMIRYSEGSSLPLISMITRNQWHNVPEPFFIHPALLQSAILLCEPSVAVLSQSSIVVNAKGYQGSLRENKTGSKKRFWQGNYKGEGARSRIMGSSCVRATWPGVTSGCYCHPSCQLQQELLFLLWQWNSHRGCVTKQAKVAVILY